MRVRPALVLALLLCVATVGAAGGLGGPPPIGDDGRSPAATDTVRPAGVDAVRQVQTPPSSASQIRVLDIPPEAVVRSSVAEQYVDLGSGVGLATNATTARLRTLSMAEHVAAADTTAERTERIRAAIRELEARVDALDRRQNAAIAAYNRDRLSSRALLVELVRISIVARELDDRRSRIRTLVAETPTLDVDRGRLASLSHRIGAFTGPVRAHARAVLQGEAPPHRFYLATGEGSVTLTTILDGTYLREAYRDDIRNGGGDQLELEVALDIVAASYPVIWNTSREQTQVFGGGGTYPVRVVHGRGDLTAFVDSDARAVYAEHQRRPIDTVVTDDRVRAVDEGLRLTVNHSYPGGPVQVRAVDDASGDPVDATVSVVAGPVPPARLGTTGDDGTLWTVSPNRRYTVTVEHRGRNVSAVVNPGGPPLAGAGTPSTTPTPTPTPASTATPTPTPTPAPTATPTPTPTPAPTATTAA